MRRASQQVCLGLACALGLGSACAAPSNDAESPAGDPTTGEPEFALSESDRARDDATLLVHSTLIQAKTARVVLSSHWRSRVKLAGIRTEKSDPGEWLARGSAEFELGNVRIEATGDITVTFLD